jgi:hypothetical protein
VSASQTELSAFFIDGRERALLAGPPEATGFRGRFPKSDPRSAL